MTSRPPWFVALVWMEVLVQLPFFVYALAAFGARSRSVRGLAAAYGVSTATTLVPILAELAARLGCSPPRGSLQVHNKFATSTSLTAEEQRLAESCTVIDRRLVATARRLAASRRRAALIPR